ncbi:MAG: insulinase family protein [Rikenellaceae bacterium]
MKKILLLLIVMLPILSFAQSNVVDFNQVVPNDTLVRSGVLDSGIKYYIRNNGKDPHRANFHIVYDVGAVQEEDNQNGLAHFLEHMAFNGSKNFPGNALVDYLQSIGVRFGENLNAGTGQEKTTYMVTNVPITREGIIDSVLLVLHDWAGFISLNSKDIDEERGVIREEWRQRNSADVRIFEKQLPVIYNNSIYSQRNIIGNEELLKTFTYDDIKSFYHKWYRPDLQAFVVVGDFDVDVMEAKLKATMADIKPFDVKTPKAQVVVADNETPLVSIVTDPETQSTQIQIIFRHSPLPKEYANRVVAQKIDIISSLVSAMIRERLDDISKKENAPFISAGAAYYQFVKPFDAFYAYATSKDGESINTLEAVYTELLRMQRGGFTTSEFERAKSNILSYKESKYNNRNDRRNGEFVNSYIANFTDNVPYFTPEYDLTLTKSILESMTLEEVNAAAKAFVRSQNSAVLISGPSSSKVPTQEEVLATLDKVNSSEIKVFSENIAMRPLVDVSKIKAGKVKKESVGQYGSTVWTLSNGVKVIVKPTDFKADQIMMKGSQLGGLSVVEDLNDLKSIEFYKYFADNAGLGDFSQSELDKMLAGKIAYAGANFGDFSVTINGSSTAKDVETMLQLAYLRMVAQRFEQSDLNVVMSQWKALIPNIVNTPDYIFQKALIKCSTGNNKRALASLPNMAMLDSVSLERMRNVYNKQFSNARGMTFVFTGNIDKATFKPLVEKYLGSLASKKKAPAYGANYVETIKGVKTRNIKTNMETPKVTVCVLYSGDMEWTLSERINLEAIRHILDVRYVKSIREEAGGTYGVSVQLETSDLPRPGYELMMYFNTDPSKVDELLPIIYKEVDDIVKNVASPENVNIFKEFAAKKFAENNISNSVWTNYLQGFYRWGYDDYTSYLQNLDSVNAETIKATANKIFTQKNIVTVVQLPN